MTEILRGPAADLIAAFARQIGSLVDEMTFCGGNVAQLLVTDPTVVRLRATDDLDVIVAITSRSAYEDLRARLSERGVVVDTRPGAPVCRFRAPDGVPVDIMPTNGRIVDLETTWFSEAVATAKRVRLVATNGEEVEVAMVSAPAFLALKWNAYTDRGHDDPIMSHDLEDIITVIAGRASITSELGQASAAMRAYVARSFRGFISHPDIDTAVEDAVPDARRIPDLRKAIVARIKDLSCES